MLQEQIDLVSVPVFVADHHSDGEFRIVALNEAHEKLTGLDQENVRGITPFEILHDPVAARAVSDHYHDCLKSDGPLKYRETLNFEQGGSLTFDTTLRKFRRANGRFRIIGTALPVTDKPGKADDDIAFFVALAKNALTTLEMLNETSGAKGPMMIDEREAVRILSRKALASLNDIEMAVSKLSANTDPHGYSAALRHVFLH